MNKLYWGLEISATLAESFIIILTLCRFFKPKFTVKLHRIFVVMSFIIASSLTIAANYSSIIHKDLLDVGIVLLYIVISVFLFKGNLYYKAIVPVILMIIILVINLSINILMSRIFHKTPEYLLTPGTDLRTLGLFLTKYTFFLVSNLLCKIIKKRSYDLKTDEWLGMVTVFLISAGILFVAEEIQYRNADSKLNMLIFIVGIAVINICVFLLINKIAKTNKQLTLLKLTNIQYNEKIKAIQSIEDIYNEARILKHDMKNEWLIVYQAFQKGDNNKVSEILKTMIGKTNDLFEENISLSNQTINSIINYKLYYAKQNGIRCTSIIQDDFDSFDEYDIVMLLANLLDNAIEANTNVKDGQIDIIICTKMNYLNIVVSNTTEGSVLSENKKLVTNKEDKDIHGFGIRSIIKIADKYNGMVDFYEQDGMFFTDVLLKKNL